MRARRSATPRPTLEGAIAAAAGIACVMTVLGAPMVAQAGPAKATAEVVGKLAGKGATKSALTRRVHALERAHGGRAVIAVDRTGHRGLRVIEGAGDDAEVVVAMLAAHGEEGLRIAGKPGALRLVRLHGDEATQAMIRHGGVAQEVIEAEGRAGARALHRLDGRNARRLAMIERDGSLGRLGRSDELLAVITRRGDVAMDFIWRHRALLASAALLTAFLADPDPYIDGLRSLADTAADAVSRPATALATEVGRSTHWTVLGLFALAMVTLWIASALRRRREMDRVIAGLDARERERPLASRRERVEVETAPAG